MKPVFSFCYVSGFRHSGCLPRFHSRLEKMTSFMPELRAAPLLDCFRRFSQRRSRKTASRLSSTCTHPSAHQDRRPPRTTASPDAIRLKIHRMFAEKEILALGSALKVVNEDDNQPNWVSKATFLKLQCLLVFARKRRHAVIGRSDIAF